MAPVVAGNPLVTEVSGDVPYAPIREPRRWPVDGADDEPIVYRYEVGTIPPEVRDSVAPGADRYFVDERGELSFIGHPASLPPRQWVRTVRAGYEYVVRFESADEMNDWEWLWKRQLWTYAMAVRHRGLALHCSLFLLPDGRAVACPGISGAGKSTISRLLAATASTTGVQVLADDRAGVVIRPDGSLRAWSTPWYSNAAMSNPGSGELVALLLLRHGRGASLVPAGQGDISRMLMRTTSLPFWSERLMADAFGMVDAMVSATRWWDFHFAPTTDEAAALVPRLLSVLDAS